MQAALKADDGADAEKTKQLKADADAIASALEEANQEYASAQDDFQTAARALNAVVGNDAAAALTLTGTLSRDTLPAADAETAASQALANRNEIKAADYAAEVEKQALAKLRYQYAVTAPEYLKQQAVLQTALAAAAQARGTVENDVRTRCAALSKAGKQLDLVEEELKKTGTAAPSDAYAAAKGDSAWSSNLAEMRTKWAEILTLRQQQISQTAQLNLDILAYGHAVGAGCTAAEI